MNQRLTALTLALLNLCVAPQVVAANLETTIWTVECGTNRQTKKIRVKAEDRETARAMINREVQSSGWCLPYNLTIVKVEVEK